ncbi:hypothetical protein shim_21100 [Shimia sp. SK013]|uniref:hypothetical protein n=1 Tax=Shimia sp. SK013 TaxID=1389006 RepID=UPI0006B65061|nr:hypothetical protein [Shimia sp. SK013]KPA21406.1 hypothetical protein shim_21100 [Shimia sp. SK013]
MPISDERFDLLLFHREIETSIACLQSGVAGIIVDLESGNKRQRQLGYDTEINSHSIADLTALRRRTDGALLCRLSQPDPDDQELAAVIGAGVNEVIVPMLTSADQAERLLSRIDGACKVTLMIETCGAVADSKKITALPVNRIYVGLNDLRIERGTSTIFAPMADGLLDRLRNSCDDVSFGFGGLTLPGKGAPLPGSHLYAEMARLGCGFTFLRRSFYRDVEKLDLGQALASIQSEILRYRNRSGAKVELDFAETARVVQALSEFRHAI